MNFSQNSGIWMSYLSLGLTNGRSLARHIASLGATLRAIHRGPSSSPRRASSASQPAAEQPVTTWVLDANVILRFLLGDHDTLTPSATSLQRRRFWQNTVTYSLALCTGLVGKRSRIASRKLLRWTG